MKIFKKILVCYLGLSLFTILGIMILPRNSYAQNTNKSEVVDGRYKNVLHETTAIDHRPFESVEILSEGGAKSARDFIMRQVADIVIPIAIVAGIAFAIIGFYRVMFSESAEATQTGIKYIVYGVIGIIILMSAGYLTEVLTHNILYEGGSSFKIDGSLIADQLYSQIAFPFLKIAFYIVIGLLFIALVGQLFKYLFSTEDKIKKSAITIISRNVIALFIIIGSKQIIEAVYGKQRNVLNQNGGNLADIGDAALHTKELPIIYTVINRVMGLTALVVLIIIIVQSYALLTNPDSADQFTRLKKSIIYIFAGIIVIGAGYLITNFLIIN